MAVCIYTCMSIYMHLFFPSWTLNLSLLWSRDPGSRGVSTLTPKEHTSQLVFFDVFWGSRFRWDLVLPQMSGMVEGTREYQSELLSQLLNSKLNRENAVPDSCCLWNWDLLPIWFCWSDMGGSLLSATAGQHRSVGFCHRDNGGLHLLHH